jgi:hypothetical protein
LVVVPFCHGEGVLTGKRGRRGRVVGLGRRKWDGREVDERERELREWDRI